MTSCVERPTAHCVCGSSLMITIAIGRFPLRNLPNVTLSLLVSPLFVIEFLHRVVETFEDYFGDCSESLIKEHYVVVYELLDEMLDNGFPLATESNILKEMIKPPNILRTIANTVTGRSK
ncbi:AP-3 complex subunit mu-1 [Araneus ventricosus]|uniref:AP-3 complex subunit mu-1 n=1 Tax=Araneus ventricosus TaxID=182803 RepID=A0A4Y2M547_ARAVE|nr:AP-3 complex subunit mu-1 [Araneus ventricosus]